MAFDPTTAQDLNLPPDVLSTLAPAEPQEQTTVSTIPPKAAFDPGSAQEIDVPPDVLFHQSSGKTVQVPPGLSGAEADFVVKKHALGEQPSRFWGIADMGVDALAAIGEKEAAFGRGSANLFSQMVPQIGLQSLRERAEILNSQTAEGSKRATGMLGAMGVEIPAEVSAYYENRPNPVAEVSKQLADSNKAWADKHFPRPTDTAGGVVFDLGSGGASLATSLAVSVMTRNPLYAGAVFGLFQKAQGYDEARAAGKSPEAASNISSLMGLAEGGLETVGTNIFLKLGHADGLMRKAVYRGFEEFVQEGSQQAAEESITNATGMRDNTLKQSLGNIGYAAALGMAVGAPSSVVLDMAVKQGDHEGVDPQVAQKIARNTLANADEVQAATVQMLEKGLNGLGVDEKQELAAADIAKRFAAGEPIAIPPGMEQAAPGPQGGNLEKMLTQRLTEKGLPADQVQSNATLVRSAYETMLQRYPELRADINKEFAGLEVGDGQTLEQGALAQSRNDFGMSSLDEMKAQWESQGLQATLSERPDEIILNKIVVPQDLRGHGLGTQMMTDLLDYADTAGKRVVLSPAADLGGNPKRLKAFYKNLGFVENKGRNKDFSTQESMIREPQKTLNQGGPQNARGAITFRPGSSIIKLFESKDASTFLHETGHFYWETMDKLSQKTNAPQRLKDDAQTIRDWVGAKSGAEITVEQHEQIARGVEAYLLQGKAPSAKLAPVFERFRQWLRDIYKSTKALKVTITPEVQGVMDRIFATDEEMQQVRQSAVAEEALGRVRFLDRQIAAIDDQMDALDRLMQERGDKPNVANQNRMDRLQAQRDVLDEERAQILTNEDTQHAFESATTQQGKTIEMQAGRLKRLAEQALEAKRRALEQGLRAGRALARTDVAAAQKLVVDTIQASGLEAKDKAKFLDTLKTIQTSVQLEKLLPKIQSRIGTLLERAAQRHAKEQLLKLLKKTKPTKQGGKPKGRFTPEIQDMLDRLRALSTIQAGEAQAQLDTRLAAYEQDDVPTPTEALENQILQIMADRDAVPSGEIEDAVATVQDLLREGKLGAAERMSARAERMADLRMMALAALESQGDRKLVDKTSFKERALTGFKEARGGAYMLQQDWHGLLNLVFGKDKTSGDEVVDQLGNGISDAFQRRKGIVRRSTEDMTTRMLRAFNMDKVSDALKQMQRDSEVKDLGIFTNAKGEEVRLQMSKAQARKRWMEMQDPTLVDTITHPNGNAYTPDMVEAVESMLTPADRDFALAQLDFYRDFYEQVNAVYSEVYGLNLPHNPFYSPISRRHAKEDETDTFHGEQNFRRSASSGSLKSRVKSVSPLRDLSDMETLQRHISQMAHFISFQEKLQEVNTVLSDNSIRDQIKDRYGSNVLQALDATRNDFGRGQLKYLREGLGWLEKRRQAFSTAILGLKPALAVKNFTQFMAYGEKIPATDFMAGVLDFAAHPKLAAKTLNDSEMLKARKTDLNRDIALALKTGEFGKFAENPKITNMMLWFATAGDRAAVMVGGWAVYKHAIKQGKSHAEALKAFEHATAESQQTSDMDRMSRLELSPNLLARNATMFMSGQNRLYRREVRAGLDMVRGKITPMEAAKKIALYHFVVPMLYQFVADFFRWDPENQARAALWGSLNGLFIMWDAMDALARKYQGEPIFKKSQSSYEFLYKALDGMGKMFGEDADEEDFYEGLKDVLTGTGLFFGVPVGRLYDAAEGASQMADQPVAGTARMLGWPNSVAKSIDENAGY